ncbi:hypothetical protein AB0F17_34695 [Nonomuraea sp. NPDC026600]|uniref:hypothetical protein n=1 Tax=Nonomuraea sp. NPDC026600 TaxID=3155363 RepID=UPI0033CB4C8D
MQQKDAPIEGNAEVQDDADEERSPYEYDLGDAKFSTLVEGTNLVCAPVPGTGDFWVLCDKDHPEVAPRIAGAVLRKAGLNI